MLLNVVESVNVTLIDIKVRICQEFRRMMPSRTPFVNGGIEL